MVSITIHSSFFILNLVYSVSIINVFKILFIPTTKCKSSENKKHNLFLSNQKYTFV